MPDLLHKLADFLASFECFLVGHEWLRMEDGDKIVNKCKICGKRIEY